MAKPTPENTLPEAQYRANILEWARSVGAEEDLKKRLKFWDEQILHAKDERERKMTISYALIDIDQFFTARKTFNFAVNDKEVASELDKRREGK